MNEEKTGTGYEKLTPQRKLLYDAVMRNLESDNLEWLQGWTGSGAPVSAISGKSYNGLNRMSLVLAAAERGYSDNRWLTYKQMEDKGWSFKRNEEGRSLGKNNRRRWDDLTRKNRQDKEVGINPDFDGAEAGNPLCNACGEEVVKKPRGRPVKVGVEKHIRITDGIRPRDKRAYRSAAIRQLQ